LGQTRRQEAFRKNMPRPFRLATLVKLREAARDERRASLADALSADAVLAKRIADLDGEHARLVADYRDAGQPGRIHVDRLIEFQRHDTLLRAARDEQRRQRDLLAAEIERRRQALVAADREVQVLEKLRLHHRHREVSQARRAEQKAIDEFALIRRGRCGDDAGNDADREATWVA
jgi:flagellar export protein FliJ